MVTAHLFPIMRPRMCLCPCGIGFSNPPFVTDCQCPQAAEQKKEAAQYTLWPSAYCQLPFYKDVSELQIHVIHTHMYPQRNAFTCTAVAHWVQHATHIPYAHIRLLQRPGFKSTPSSLLCLPSLFLLAFLSTALS